VSFDAIDWTPVDGGAEFTGNVENHAVVRNDFAGVVTARYVRINPVYYHGYMSMRAGVYVRDPITCAAEEAAADVAAAALPCVPVQESYATPAVSFSSMIAAGHDRPQLNNQDDNPCWAAATNDQDQVSPRTVLPPLK